MYIQTKGTLLFEMMKIKEAVKTKNTKLISSYYDDYLNFLKVPSKEVFRSGPFTVCSEKISFHLLSVYLLLDIIDLCWNGDKFLRSHYNGTPELMKYLNSDKKIEFPHVEDIKRFTYEVQKISRTQLHIFLLPYEYDLPFVSAYTHPGNALILFSKKDEASNNYILNALHQGLADFYFKKQLKEILPYWADSEDGFKHEFIKWCNNSPSKFTARKVK